MIEAVSAFLERKPLADGVVISTGDRLLVATRSGSVETIAVWDWYGEGTVRLTQGAGPTAHKVWAVLNRLLE